jgi:hypothetical protein
LYHLPPADYLIQRLKFSMSWPLRRCYRLLAEDRRLDNLLPDLIIRFPAPYAIA